MKKLIEGKKLSLQNFQNIKEFNEKLCDFCGLCFHKCPALELPLNIAKNEIKSLVQKGESKYILTKCTSCMACNHFCPNNCNPHTLILQKWNERYLKNGLPNRAKFVLPYHFPNLYSMNIKKLPKDELELIREWENNWNDPPENHDIMFYTGCNTLIQPYMLKSRLFQDMPIFGSPECCCGEPFYRMGCLDAAEQVAHHLKVNFERMGFKKLIVGCLAGYHLFKEIHKEVFGIKYNFETISFIDWLWEALNSGKYDISKLDISAVLHDNCWSKASGNYFFDKVREILKFIGVNIIEPKHTRESALCCGIGAAAANYSIIYAFKSAIRRLREFKRTDAVIVVDYCGGCNWYFNIAQRFSIKKIPIYHLIELIQMAIGEKPIHRTRKRGNKIFIFKFMIRKVIASYFKKKKHKIKKILDLPVPREKNNVD